MAGKKKPEVGRVQVFCPKCGKWVMPDAVGERLGHAYLDILVEKDKGVCRSMLNWDDGDIEIEFSYRCPSCDERLFDSLDTLDEMLKDPAKARMEQ